MTMQDDDLAALDPLVQSVQEAYARQEQRGRTTFADIGINLPEERLAELEARLQERVGFWEGVTPDATNVPFAGAVAEVGSLVDFQRLATKFQAGEATPEEQDAFLSQLVEQARPRGDGGGFEAGAIGEGLMGSLTVMAELGTGAGAMAAAERAAVKAGLLAARKAATRSVRQRLARSLAQGATTVGLRGVTEGVARLTGEGGGQWTANALQRVIPNAEWTEDELDEFATLAEEDFAGRFLERVTSEHPVFKGMLEDALSTGVEATGGTVIGRIPGMAPLRAAQARVFQKLAGDATGAEAKRRIVRGLADAVAYNGAIEEVGEELLQGMFVEGAFGEGAMSGLPQSWSELLTIASVSAIPGAAGPIAARAIDLRRQAEAAQQQAPADEGTGGRQGTSTATGGDVISPQGEATAATAGVDPGVSPAQRAADVEAFRASVRSATGSDIEMAPLESPDGAEGVARLLERFKVAPTFVRAGADAPAGFFPGEGRAVINLDAAELEGVALHEAMHTWESQQAPERVAELDAELRAIDPAFMQRVQAYWESITPLKDASPGLVAEETRTTATQLLAPLITYLDTPRGVSDFAKVYTESPGLLRRTLEAIQDFLASFVPFLPASARARAQANLDRARGNLPQSAPQLASALLDALDEIRPAIQTAVAAQAPSNGNGNGKANGSGRATAFGQAQIPDAFSPLAAPGKPDLSPRPRTEQPAPQRDLSRDSVEDRTPMPGDRVRLMRASKYGIATNGPDLGLEAEVIETTGSGGNTRHKIRLDGGTFGNASRNRKYRGDRTLTVDRGEIRLLKRTDPATMDPTSKRMKNRKRAEAEMAARAEPRFAARPSRERERELAAGVDAYFRDPEDSTRLRRFYHGAADPTLTFFDPARRGQNEGGDAMWGYSLSTRADVAEAYLPTADDTFDAIEPLQRKLDDFKRQAEKTGVLHAGTARAGDLILMYREREALANGADLLDIIYVPVEPMPTDPGYDEELERAWAYWAPKIDEAQREFARLQGALNEAMAQARRDGLRSNRPSGGLLELHVIPKAPHFVDFKDQYWDVEQQKAGIREARERQADVVVFRNIQDHPQGKFVRGQDTVFVLDNRIIKSATGNRGTFDLENPDIRFAAGITPEARAALEAQGLAAPIGVTASFLDEAQLITRWDRFMRGISDEFLALDKYVKAVKKLGGKLDANPESAVRRYFGKIAERGDQIERRFLNPMVDHLGKHKIKLDEAGEFVEVRHIPEANEAFYQKHLRRKAIATELAALKRRASKLERNEQVEKGIRALQREADRLAFVPLRIPDNADAREFFHEINPMSGMKTSEAKAKAAEYAKREGFHELGKMVDAMNRHTRDQLLRDGLITQEQYDEWSAQFHHYVPLRTAEVDRPEGPRSSGFSVRGPESKQRKGRKSRASNPLIMSYVQALNGAQRAEKNAVGLEFRDFLLANRGLLEASERQVELGPDGTPQLSETELHVKVNGQDVAIGVQNKDVADALRRVGLAQAPEFMKLYQGAMRIWRAMVTSANPEFVFSNFDRDIQTALVNTSSVAEEFDLTKLRRGLLKRIPAAAKAIYGHLREKTDWDPSLRARFDEYRENGGTIGTFTSPSFEEQRKGIERELKRQGRPAIWRKPANAAAGAWDFVEDVNQTVETATRFALYAELRDRGVSAKDAAYVARQLTVDFSQKGTWGTAISMMYAFFSAGVGGTRRVFQELARSKVARGIAAAATAQGFLAAFLNEAISGEDEDGQTFYSKLPEYEKEKFLMLMVGDEPVKMMMPWGYSVFPNLGRLAAEVVQGKKSMGEAAQRMLIVTADNFNPMGTAPSLSQLLAPTIIDPLIQIQDNENFAGTPIRPADIPFGPETPKYQRSGKSTPGFDIAIAEALNDLTGGDSVKPGWFNLAGDDVEHIRDFLGGGVGRFVANSIVTARAMANGEWNPETTPFLRKVYGARTEFVDTQNFYRALEEIEYQKRYIKEAREAGDLEAVRELQRRYGPTLRLERAGKRAREMAGKLRDEAREGRGFLEQAKPVEMEAANAAMKDWYRKYLEASAQAHSAGTGR